MGGLLISGWTAAHTRREHIYLPSSFAHASHIHAHILCLPRADEIDAFVRQRLGRKRAILLPRVKIITQPLTPHEYGRFLASLHAFVLPTRGEGWGLPLVGDA